MPTAQRACVYGGVTVRWCLLFVPASKKMFQTVAYHLLYSPKAMYCTLRAHPPAPPYPRPLAAALSPSCRNEEGVDALVVRHTHERLLATALHLVTHGHQLVRLLPMDAL